MIAIGAISRRYAPVYNVYEQQIYIKILNLTASIPIIGFQEHHKEYCNVVNYFSDA